MCDAGSTNIATNSATTASTASVESLKPSVPQERPTSPFPEIPDVTTLNTQEIIKTERDIRINRPVTPIQSISPIPFAHIVETSKKESLQRVESTVETKMETISSKVEEFRPVSPFPMIPDVSLMKTNELMQETKADETICRSISPVPPKVEFKQVPLHDFNKIPAPFSSYGSSEFKPVVVSNMNVQKQKDSLVTVQKVVETPQVPQFKFPQRPVSPYPVYIPKSPEPFQTGTADSFSLSQSLEQEKKEIVKSEVVQTKQVSRQVSSQVVKKEEKEEKIEVMCTKAPEAVIGAKPLFGQLDINNELKKAFGLSNKTEARKGHVKNKASKMGQDMKVVSSNIHNIESKTEEVDAKKEEHLASDFISKNLIFNIDEKDIKTSVAQFDQLVSEQNGVQNHIEQNYDSVTEEVKNEAVKEEVKENGHVEVQEIREEKQQQQVASTNEVVETKVQESVSNGISSEKSAFVAVQPQVQETFDEKKHVSVSESSTAENKVQEMAAEHTKTETRVEQSETHQSKTFQQSSVQSLKKLEIIENNQVESEEYQTPPIQSLIQTFEQSTMPVMKYKQIRESTNSNTSTNSSVAQFFSVNKENVSPVPDTTSATKHVDTPTLNGHAKPDNLYYVSQTSVENRVFGPESVETKSSSEQFMSEEKSSMFSEFSSSKQYMESSSSSHMSTQMSSSNLNSSSQTVNCQQSGGLQLSGKDASFFCFLYSLFFLGFPGVCF